ncbi:MAG: hypothetical protein K5870_00910 [Lachnospiraceae bacterium]|nr:hypothetical protein [Lachnospiraceae bacterium]
MTREEIIKALNEIKECPIGLKAWYIVALEMAIKALSQEPCEVSEYDKDHIWYKGNQYISLCRFLEVKAEAEKKPCDDLASRQTVKEQMIKYGFHAPDMTVTEFVEDLPPVNQKSNE